MDYRKRYKKVFIEVEEGREEHFLRIFSELKSYAFGNKKAPRKLIADLMSPVRETVFKLGDIDHLKAMQVSNEISFKTITYFKSCPKYYFEYRRENKVIDFGFMIDRIYGDLIYANNDSELRKNRNKCICFIYDSLCKYIFDNPVKKFTEKEYSKFKLYVITAYMTREMGFPLTEKKTTTNEELFQTVRKIIDKHRKVKN